jgi:osmoprotectant transport system ATP-binding protein
MDHSFCELSVDRDRLTRYVGRRMAVGDPRRPSVIEFRGVTKRYPDGTVAVDELDLEVEAGRITVFVGPSGCGKTTSLRMINRMIEPTEGTILVDGKDIMAGDPAELRRGIGYVIQQAGLFPHRTILDNIATVPLLLGWSKADARKRAAELMETVGLAPEMAKRYPTQLSGGQQQRVGVARALAADPPILLMDEPFSAVDPVVRESLQEELLRLQDELGKTIVFVTHDIDEAVKLGDKVAVLRVGGKLAQFDDPGHLLARPVDDFVDNFVGRDRGYRGLGFRSSAALTLGELPTVTLGEKPARHAGWVLVVDAEGRPQGWLNTAESAPDAAVAPEQLVPGGSLYVVGSGSLRSALDAALSSPSGVGVAVDESGAVVGSVSADDVLRVLDDARRDDAA